MAPAVLSTTASYFVLRALVRRGVASRARLRLRRHVRMLSAPDHESLNPRTGRFGDLN